MWQPEKQKTDNPADTPVGIYRHAAEGKRLFLHWSLLMPHQDITPREKGHLTHYEEDRKQKTEHRRGWLLVYRIDLRARRDRPWIEAKKEP